MARYRINPNAVCSSKNYKQSKKLHMDMLKRNHEELDGIGNLMQLYKFNGRDVRALDNNVYFCTR